MKRTREDRVSINVTNVQRDKRRPPPPTFILRGGENDITALEFLTFPYLASGTVSGRLKIWSFVNRRVVYEFSPHGNFGILELIFISRKNIENNSVEIVFFSQGRDGLIKAWLLLVKHSEGIGDQLSIEPISVVENGSLAYCKIFVCRHLTLANAVYIASPSGEDGELAMYKFVDDKFLNLCVTKFSTDGAQEGISNFRKNDGNKTGMVMCLNMINDFLVLIGYESGDLCLFNLQEEAFKATIKGHADSILAIDFAEYKILNDSNSEETLAKRVSYRGFSGGADKLLVVYQLNAFTGELREKKKLEIACKGIADIKIRRLSVFEATKVKYQIVLCACWDGRVRIFGFKKVQLLACLAYHDGSVYNLCLPRPDSEDQSNGESAGKTFEKGLFVSAGKDGRIACWDIYGDKM